MIIAMIVIIYIWNLAQIPRSLEHVERTMWHDVADVHVHPKSLQMQSHCRIYKCKYHCRYCKCRIVVKVVRACSKLSLSIDAKYIVCASTCSTCIHIINCAISIRSRNI